MPHDDPGYAKLLQLSTLAGMTPKHDPNLANYHVNLAYAKFGRAASEGIHNDSSHLLLSELQDEPTRDIGGRHFPTLRSLQVGTFSLGHAAYRGLTKLTHAVGKGNAAGILSQVLLNNNTHNSQSFGLNALAFHKSDPVPATIADSPAMRLRITMRFTQDCCHSATLIPYKKHSRGDHIAPEQLRKSKKICYSGFDVTSVNPATGIRVLAPGRNCNRIPSWCAEDNYSESTMLQPPQHVKRSTIVPLQKLQPKDLAEFRQQELVEIKKLLPDCPDGGMGKGVSQPMIVNAVKGFGRSALVRYARTVRAMLQSGKVPWLTCQDGTDDKFYAMHTKYGLPTAAWQELSQDDLVIKVCNRQSPSSNHDLPCQAMSTHPYKYDSSFVTELHFRLSESMAAFSNIVRDSNNHLCRKSDDFERLLHRLDSEGEMTHPDDEVTRKAIPLARRWKELQDQFSRLPPIPFGGSGGAHQAAGAQSINLSVDKDNDAQYTACYAQDTNTPENQALKAMVDAGNLISLVVNKKHWFKDERDEDFFKEGSPEMNFMLGQSGMSAGEEREFIDQVLEKRKLKKRSEKLKAQERRKLERMQRKKPAPGPVAPLDCDEVDQHSDDDMTDLHPQPNREGAANEFRHVFHYQAVKQEYLDGVKDLDGLVKRFLHIEGDYVKNNLDTISYLQEVHYCVMMEPALGFNVEWDLLMQEDGDYERMIIVSDDAADILRCDNNAVVAYKTEKCSKADKSRLESMGLTKFPHKLITKEDIYDYLESIHKTELLVKALSQLENAGRLFSVLACNVPALIVSTMLAASFRISRQYSVRKVRPLDKTAAAEQRYCEREEVSSSGSAEDDPQLMEEATPLMGRPVQALPDSLRMKPTPCCNRDADVSTCLFRDTFWKIVNGGATAIVQPLRRFTKSCRLPDDLSSDAVLDMLADMWYAATVNRIFDPEKISGWRLSRRQSGTDDGFSLPLRRHAQEFTEWLKAQTRMGVDLRSQLNKQHPPVLPDCFLGKLEALEAICRFLTAYASSEGSDHGVALVRGYFRYMGEKNISLQPHGGNWEERWSDLFARTLWALASCGGYFFFDSGTHFLVQVIMADVESGIPNLCGMVNLAWMFLGTGSSIGIRLCTRRWAKHPIRIRLQHFHAELKALLMALTWVELSLMGYFEEGGELFSVFTGRRFTYLDTEHILCKVYICLAIAHASRTISNNPTCRSTFTWPISNACVFWTDVFRKEMDKEILQLYLDLPDEARHAVEAMIKEEYPPQLRYQQVYH